MRQILNSGFIYISLVVSLIIIMSCETTNISQVPYKKEYSKYVNKLAILYPAENPEMNVKIRSDEQFITTLLTGPAIIPQILMQIAFLSARKDDVRIFNDMLFDLNIGEVLCEKLNTKFQLCSYLHVVPQENITKNKVVWKLLEKKNKDLKDYQRIGTELGIDTLLEINIISYGIKDPGIFSDPYAVLKADVKMTTVTEGAVLWRDIIEARTMIEIDTTDSISNTYEDAQFIKEEFERVADVLSEECIERLGFDTNYTYLLDKDYLNDKKNKIDIAKKLGELNNLRYDSLITDTDYDEKKLNLIERAKNRKNFHYRNTQIDTENKRQ